MESCKVVQDKQIGVGLDQWRDVLSCFASLRRVLQDDALGAWARLLAGFASLRNALQTAVGEPSASRCTFNVFEVTRRSGFEVTTHSALLCDLLDPRGSHGQGGAFLKAFLEIVDANLPADAARPPWPPADGWWRAATEFRAHQGRLDILVRNDGPSGPATIVIENKWDHCLGDGQLERYDEYLADLGSLRRKCLVYLTRRGAAPQVALTVDLVCLSHSRDIARLIRRTLDSLTQTAPPALREPLLQYCLILDDDGD